jgi:uncharacterized repeat protein (TIGR01451 family)
MLRSKSKLWWYRGWLCAVLMVLVISPAAAGSPARQAAAETPSGSRIYLAAGTFDPLAEAPDLPEGLIYDAESAAADGAYLVQLTGPVLESWKQALEAQGAELGPYIPDYAFIAHLDKVSKQKVENLEFVRWVGAFEPAYRISPRAAELDQHAYRITLLPWADSSAVSRLLEGFAHLSGSGERVTQYAANGLRAVLDAEGAQQAARLPGVLWVEPIELNETFNDVAGGILNAPVAWNVAGLDGSGITIGVADTGLNLTHGDFTGRVAQAISYPIAYDTYGGCSVVNTGLEDGVEDLNTGHGTHVTGSLAGSGYRSGGTFRGMAYDAAIIFQALEVWTDFVDTCQDGYRLSGIPLDVGVLLEDAYARGVRVHNDSWGRPAGGDYYEDASRFDQHIFQHPDLLVTVAAGNYGKDTNRDGFVDPDSISSLGSAKNVLSIGASDNERDEGGWSSYTWFYLGYPTDPTKTDLMSDNAGELAAFSSRGPTADGRIKPDLVAPGTNIISARAQNADYLDNWGAYDEYYMYNGGTSMAAPLAAGAAALVREYYIEKMLLANPSAALIKATLINTAVDMPGYGNPSYEAGQPIPNVHEGWGRIDVGAAVTTGARQVQDNWIGLATNGAQTTQFQVESGVPFKVTLVWSDKEAVPNAAKTLVNDLDLQVTAPDGTLYLGNVFSGGWSGSDPESSADKTNNVENVYIHFPTAGIWRVTVRGANVPNGPQPFALVVDGSLVPFSTPQVASITPGMGLNDAPVEGVTITGSSLLGNTTVKLVKDAKTIQGEITANSDSQIIADFDLTGEAPGLYAVVVSTKAGTGTLAEAFTVLDSSLPDLRLTLEASQNQYSITEMLQFTLTVENNSQVDASGVSFVQTFPPGISLENVENCVETLLEAGNGYQCLVGELEGMEARSFTITAQVEDEELRNVQVTEASVSSEAERWLPDNTDLAFFWLDSALIWLPVLVR